MLRAAACEAEITPRALDALASYAWPGNVRELQHQMQRLAALRPRRIDLEHLSREIRAGASASSGGASARRNAGASALPARTVRTLDENAQKAEVRRALEATGGNISRAADMLGLTRHGLKKRLVRLGMRPPKEAS